jgi:DNL zinc finger
VFASYSHTDEPPLVIDRCDNAYTQQISRVAYYEGVVICTCKGCNVKHLIADNKGLLDFPEFGRNIEEYMAAQNNGERYAFVSQKHHHHTIQSYAVTVQAVLCAGVDLVVHGH